MSIRTEQEEQGIRAAGRMVAEVIREVRSAVAPGRTTAELDAVAHAAIARRGGVAAPRAYYSFPGAICLSVNEEVVHGVPGPRMLRAGDLLTIDVTLEKDGYIADAAVTVPVGEVTARGRRLIACAEAAFQKALPVVRPGVPAWRIGEAVDREVRRWGYRVVRELRGHGVGRAIHEAPEVPNYADRSCRDRLEEGMVLTIEPIIAARRPGVYLRPDQWTVCTDDGSLAAHHEHTLIVTRRGPALVTVA
jgi:methionyl aminopeptidase